MCSKHLTCRAVSQAQLSNSDNLMGPVFVISKNWSSERLLAMELIFSIRTVTQRGKKNICLIHTDLNGAFPGMATRGQQAPRTYSVPTMALLQRGPKRAPLLPPSPSLWVAESCCLALSTDPNPPEIVHSRCLIALLNYITAQAFWRRGGAELTGASCSDAHF